jgi:hypothetical protein
MIVIVHNAAMQTEPSEAFGPMPISLSVGNCLLYCAVALDN